MSASCRSGRPPDRKPRSRPPAKARADGSPQWLRIFDVGLSAGVATPASSAVSGQTAPGWGGRDRTSEWRNQNPLPYRLATPQQATNGTAEELVTADSLQSQPVYRERRGISTAWRAKYHRLRRLGRGTLCCWPDDRPVPATAGRPDS